ncbi:chromatin modification-related protein EAF1 B-like isoform X1 [Ipomoea triloba]|uniref:chromatin modification-related protein EAF1 B-like isoform X1 n=1 Tax=Ipomoea triloba TaxID=35885 RepID=UPI00125E0805|nr:chromatin modification-related protein EAF1 B-like isoform X1 [Ipomoea triloba]
MHGSATCALVVNAEVDLMGGVVEGGVGGGTETSPWSAALEKVQEKLRQEFDVRDESRRQLEFLEKGGDPLEFKYGNAASVSVQSTSPTDQQPDQFVTSEAKGSFAFTASPHGDSVESIGRPGATLICEPNSADNLMLFDGENESVEGEQRISRNLSRTSTATPEQSTQMDGNQSAKELGDSAAFEVPRKAYKRRVRPRPNRDGARSSSNDVLACVGHGSLPSHNGLSDAKGLVVDAENKAIQNGTGLPNGDATCKNIPSDNQVDLESTGAKAAESTTDLMKDGQLNTVSDSIFSKDQINIQQDQDSAVVAQETPIEVAPVEPESLTEKEKIGLAGQLCADSEKIEILSGSGQINGFISAKGENKSIANNNAALVTKGLESESSCTHPSLSLDRNNDSDMCTNLKILDSNGNTKVQSSVPEGAAITEIKEVKESKADDICLSINEGCKPMHENDQENEIGQKPMEELDSSHSDLQTKVKDKILVEGKEPVGHTSSETELKSSVPVGDNSNPQNDNTCGVVLQGSNDSSIPQLAEASPLVAVSTAPSGGHQSGVNTELLSKADENSILEEARIIQAKHKRIAELSAVTCPMENRRRSHWDYVLEEMAWLANDFVQERLWKITAASKISYHAAFTSRLRFQECNSSRKQKTVARTLAKFVTDFWHSVKGSTEKLDLQCPKEGFGLAIKEYAVRFLKYNSTDVPPSQTEVPATLERIIDSEIIDVPWEDHLTEENLFYTVPPSAIEIYRKSIESHVLQCEKVGSSMQEELEMPGCEAVADLGSQDYLYEEDEGETSTYNLSVAFEGSNSSRFVQKKRKIQIRTNSGRSFDNGADLSFTHYMENKIVNQQSTLQAKRPASSLNVSFPTKRVRTGSRQRVLSPFIGGTSGLQLPIKTDASSGETSSFQDDQSTLHGGSRMPNTLEVESVVDFEKQLQFDSAEVSTKPKKKKKNSSYEQRWQDDSNFQNEQRENSKKRLEGHQIESNGSSGLFGLHIPKKPKILRPSLENSFDNMSPVTGSIPSPAASQMSNMSNPNKIMKVLSSRDRNRKGKNLKSPAGNLISGSQWSLFEDQALVVLVHDMGPNWELVSDAINSTLQFKCIYRKPKECKDRHKILMDKTNGDAADSAEDSGSSQPYPSTLPGIPKGSARQLFQRLKGPMEEDTLKSHFDKIIIIGQKYQFHKTQGDNRDPKHLQQPHSSHANALSEVMPNKMTGLSVLTPLDLCDASPPSSDIVSPGYQGPHSSALANSNPALLGPAATAPGANSALQVPSNVMVGNNFSSSSNPLNATVRDGRYAVSRSASVPFTEQQRMHPYNRMLPGRNIHQSNSATPGGFPGANPGVRMLPGGNGVGIMCGTNRSMPVRPGYQGISPSSMLNSGSMVSSGMVPNANSVNMHSGIGSNQGNSMMRPHDTLNMMQPTQNQDSQRQMMVPEHQMQVSPGNSQYGGLNSSYANQTASPPASSYPVNQQSHPMSAQQPHVLASHHAHLQGSNNATNPQKQALMQFAKDRQYQQRLLQQQFGTSSPLMPPIQQHQLPVSSPSQNSPQITSQSSPPASLSPMPSTSSMTPVPQHQLKHPISPHGLGRGAQSGGNASTNQASKQRPRQTHMQQQQLQQSSRSHLQQRKQLQPQQQAKLLQGAGRGNMIANQNMPIDPSLVNGINTSLGNRAEEKVDQVTQPMQTQGLYPRSNLNPVQPTKPSAPHTNAKMPQSQQKMYSVKIASQTESLQQTPSHSDEVNHGHGPPTALGSALPSCHQPRLPAQKNLMNQSQPNSQRVMQPTGCNSSLGGTMKAAPRECSNTANVASTTVPANVSQWKGAEPLFDSAGAQTQPSNPAGSELSSQVGQGLNQRRPSGNLSSEGHEASVQLQQQQQQPHSPLHEPQQQQLPSLKKSLQPQQVMQAGNNSFYAHPSISGPD